MPAVGPHGRTHLALGLCLLAVALGSHGVNALKEAIVPQSFETVFVLLLYDVGLAPGAVVSLNVSNASPANGTVVVILTASQWASWSRQLRRNQAGTYSSYLVSYWRHPLNEQLVIRHRIRAAKPDRYYIGVLNTQLTRLIVEGDVAYTNPDGQHLPLQWAHLPDTLRVASIAFFWLLMASIMLLLVSDCWRISNPLHGILVACLFFKMLELALEWKYFEMLSLDGTAPMWRFQVWQLASKVHTILEMFLLLLTAIGWRLLRRRLSAAEIRFAMLTMSLSTTLAVLEVCSSLGANLNEPVIIFDLFAVVRVVCYLVIYFAINFNLQLIAVHLTESPATPAVSTIYQKQQVFQVIRRIFLTLVFRPSIINWLRVAVLNTEGTEWAADVLSEASGWMIYAALLDALKPCPRRMRIADLMRIPSPGEVAEEQAVYTSNQESTAWAAPAAVAPRSSVGSEDLDEFSAPYVSLAGGE